MGNPQLLLGFVSKPGLSILPPHRSEGDSAHGTGISQLLNRMEWEPWGYVVSQTTTVSHGLKVGGRGNSSEEHAFLALVSPEIRTSKINIAFIWWPHRTAQHLKVLPSQIMPEMGTKVWPLCSRSKAQLQATWKTFTSWLKSSELFFL